MNVTTLNMTHDDKMYLLWITIFIILGLKLTTAWSDSDRLCSEKVPITLEGPLHSYPNLLNITTEEQALFHPIVKFRKAPTILNLTGIQGSTELSRKRRNLIQRLFLHLGQNYTIGKYDEDRVSLYSSALFQNENNIIDGFDGARTVHVGIDLGGPIGTKVYSFMDGVVSSVGYNKELGDYGCVIVVKYDLKDLYQSSQASSPRVFYALYGHLNWDVMRKKKGQRVMAGEILGRMGDVHLNGGWKTPHVHFQLSMNEPKTHDLPGAVAMRDRSKALCEYPDPRWILGELY